jgi:hypothetical protein
MTLVSRSVERMVILLVALSLALVAAQVVNGRITTGIGTAAAAVGPCNADTAFFGSAPTNTQFAVGDTWQGGTFTNITINDPAVNDVVNARVVVTGDQVGRFPSVVGGSTATIKFAQPITVTAILWFGNDPEAGETGWSVNGIAGPNTGDQGAQCTFHTLVTDTVTVWTDDSGGFDFYIGAPGGAEGCTPGYWKQEHHFDSWTTYTPGQTLESVFDVPDSLGMDNTTLVAALGGGGGSGVAGGAKILLRAAVASLLNSTSAGVDFSMSTADVISQVNAALASMSRATMLALAGTLDTENNKGCPLN